MIKLTVQLMLYLLIVICLGCSSATRFSSIDSALTGYEDPLHPFGVMVGINHAPMIGDIRSEIHDGSIEFSLIEVNDNELDTINNCSVVITSGSADYLKSWDSLDAESCLYPLTIDILLIPGDAKEIRILYKIEDTAGSILQATKSFKIKR